MPITNVANVITYTDKGDPWNSNKTGVYSSSDFAVADKSDPTKQIAFDPSAIAANSTITLAAPTASGTLSVVGGPGSLQFSAPATAASVAYAPGTSHLVLAPIATIATLTITLPAGVDGKRVSFCSTQIVTALTLTPAGSDTLFSDTTALAVNTPVNYVFRATGAKWYVCG